MERFQRLKNAGTGCRHIRVDSPFQRNLDHQLLTAASPDTQLRGNKTMATHLARFLPALILCTFLVMFTGHARAQAPGTPQAGNDNTAALGDQNKAGAPATSEHHELGTDGVSATITVLRTDRPFPVGGSAFVQIKLKSTARNKRVGAELVFETETAEIRDVSGERLKLRKEGTVHIASVEQIAPRKPRIVIVEIALRGGDTPNKLKVTLRKPGGTGESATLGWKVANCAAEFYSHIVKVRRGSGAGLADAIKAARSKDRTRPGRWLFPPRLKIAGASRKCVRSVKHWNKRRGRYQYRCTRYETVSQPAAGTVTRVKAERGIYNFASRYVSARARDRELSQTRDSGWATNRVSQNLQGFLKQKSHPAICTGVIPFFNYFDERMEGFLKRATKFDDMAGKAASLAQLRTSEAIDAVKVEPGGHPGWGSAPLDLPQGAGEKALKNQVEALAQLANDAELRQRIYQADNVFGALRAMSDFFGTDAGKTVAGPVQTIMYRALSAIEAADYIGTVNRHYADLRHALSGSMSTIRQAHANNCTCGG